MGVPPDRVDEVAKVSQNIAAERFSRSMKLEGRPGPEADADLRHVKKALDKVIQGPPNGEVLRIGFADVIIDPRTGLPVSGLYEWAEKKALVSRLVKSRTVTALHEIGHFADETIFDPARGAISTAALVRLIESAIRGSLAYRELEELRNGRFPREILDVEYLLEDRELFARAFAQYVILRGGTKTTRDQFKVRRSGFARNGYWTDDDFKPIAKAFDDVI